MRSFRQRMRRLGSSSDDTVTHPISGEAHRLALVGAVPTDGHPPTILTFEASKLDMNLSSSADFMGMFKSEMKTDYSYYVLNLEVSTPKLLATKSGESAVNHVMGVRLAMAFSQLAVDTKNSMNIAAATANLQVSFKSFSTRVTSKGVEKTNELERKLLGDFDMQSMEVLGEVLPAPFDWVGSKGLTQLEDIGVQFDQPETYLPIIRLASASFALGCISYNGMSFKQAEARVKEVWNAAHKPLRRKFIEAIDLSIVRSLYMSLGIAGEHEQPTGDQKSAADRMWKGIAPTASDAQAPAASFQVIDRQVEPYLAPTATENEYSIASLWTLSPEKWILASDKAVEGSPEKDTATQDLSVEAVLDAGFASIVNVSSDTKVFYKMKNVIQKWVKPGRPGSIVREEVHTRGFRICVCYFAQGLDSELSLSMIAAKAELNLVNTAFAVQSIGIDVRELGGLSELVIASTGPFNAAALEQVGLIAQKFFSPLEKKPASNELCLSAVSLDIGHPVFAEVYKVTPVYLYAVQQIYARRSFAEGTRTIPGEEERLRIREVYEYLMGRRFTPDAQPNGDDSNAAYSIFWLCWNGDPAVQSEVPRNIGDPPTGA